MTSINLLPKAFDYKYREKNAKKIASLVSFLMIMISVVVYAYLFVNNRNLSEKVNALSLGISENEKKIKEEIANNKLLYVEITGKNAGLILEKHTYFTKAIGIVQDNLIDEIYLDSLDTFYDDKKGLAFNFNGIARDYSAVANQLAAFKKLPLIEDAQIKSISANKMGLLDFSCDLKIKENVLFYEDKKDSFD